MKKLPDNPLQKPDFGDEISATEVTAVLDRQRRNYELMEGGAQQEDSAFSDRVSVPSGTEVTLTVKPKNEKVFFLEEINVNPTLSAMDYKLVADDTTTTATVLPFGVPKVIRDKIQVSIKNNNSTTESFQIVGDAREVSQVKN